MNDCVAQATSASASGRFQTYQHSLLGPQPSRFLKMNALARNGKETPQLEGSVTGYLAALLE